MVLPNGTIAIANNLVNQDLFWGLRGAGGSNFGVVSEAEFRLFPAEAIYFAGQPCFSTISNRTALQQLVEIFWEAATEMEVCIDNICRLFLLGCCKWCVESGTKNRGIAVGLKRDEARDCLISH